LFLKCIIYVMPSKAKIIKARKKPKFSTRRLNPCVECGRFNFVIREYGLCRIDFKRKADRGELPGVKKASW